MNSTKETPVEEKDSPEVTHVSVEQVQDAVRARMNMIAQHIIDVANVFKLGSIDFGFELEDGSKGSIKLEEAAKAEPEPEKGA